MIQINDDSFDTVFKIDARMDNKKYAGGVIFANSNKDALMIAKHLVKDIQSRIELNKEEDDVNN